MPGMIDREGIERDRDQLWAEAVARFKAGAKWWLETPELEALATAEQEMRFKVDVWKEPRLEMARQAERHERRRGASARAGFCAEGADAFRANPGRRTSSRISASQNFASRKKGESGRQNRYQKM